MRMKRYRGMGSKDAITKRHGNAVRYYNDFNKNTPIVSQGVSGTVADKGSIHRFIPYLLQGLRHSLQNIGCLTIKELHQIMNSGILRFEIRSHASQLEGGVHSLTNVDRTEY